MLFGFERGYHLFGQTSLACLISLFSLGGMSGRCNQTVQANRSAQPKPFVRYTELVPTSHHLHLENLQRVTHSSLQRESTYCRSFVEMGKSVA